MDSNELVTVYTVANPVMGEIVKNSLQAEGIRCFLEGECQAGEAGLNIMEIKVQVPAAEADRASRFIRAHEAGRKVHGTLDAHGRSENETMRSGTPVHSFSGTHHKWR